MTEIHHCDHVFACPSVRYFGAFKVMPYFKSPWEHSYLKALKVAVKDLYVDITVANLQRLSFADHCSWACHQRVYLEASSRRSYVLWAHSEGNTSLMYCNERRSMDFWRVYRRSMSRINMESKTEAFISVFMVKRTCVCQSCFKCLIFAGVGSAWSCEGVKSAGNIYHIDENFWK